MSALRLARSACALSLVLGGCSIDDNRPDVWRTGPGMLADQFPRDEANCNNEARALVAINRFAYFRSVWMDCMVGKGWLYMGKQ